MAGPASEAHRFHHRASGLALDPSRCLPVLPPQALYYGRPVKPTDLITGPVEGIALLWRAARLEKLADSIVR